MDWSGFGQAAGNYLASKSPIGSAVYKGVTGEDPTQNQSFGTMAANSIIGRYKRGSDPNQTMMGPNPTPSELSAPIYNDEPKPPTDPGLPPPMPLQTPPMLSDPGMGASASDPNAANESQWNKDSSGGSKGGGLSSIAGMMMMKHGGIASEPTIAKVGESGMEMAGGKVISSPTLVRLKKGEAVIPMTPRPENKLQPDMIPGMSRYRSHMSGGMR